MDNGAACGMSRPWNLSPCARCVAPLPPSGPPSSKWYMLLLLEAPLRWLPLRPPLLPRLALLRRDAPEDVRRRPRAGVPVDEPVTASWMAAPTASTDSRVSGVRVRLRWREVGRGIGSGASGARIGVGGTRGGRTPRVRSLLDDWETDNGAADAATRSSRGFRSFPVRFEWPPLRLDFGVDRLAALATAAVVVVVVVGGGDGASSRASMTSGISVLSMLLATSAGGAGAVVVAAAAAATARLGDCG